MSSPTSSFSLAPVVPADVPVLSEISGLGFEPDRHTMLKAAYTPRPYDYAGGMAGAFEYWRSLPPGRVEVTKAVDDQTGEVLGFVCWAMRLDKPDAQHAQKRGTGEVEVAEGDSKKPDTSITEDHVKTDSPDLDPLAQLEQLTSSHLADYQKRVMPSGTRCMYVIGITVHPKHQGRGIGEALMRQGTQRADAERVFCWVHSSEIGAALFRKCGFMFDETLEIDLDEWAGKMDVKPPAGDGKWGTYTFRYMVRQPRPV